MKYFDQWNYDNNNSESAASYIASAWYDAQDVNSTSINMINIIKSALPIMWAMPDDATFLLSEVENAVSFMEMFVTLHMPFDSSIDSVAHALSSVAEGEDHIVAASQLVSSDLLKQSIALRVIQMFAQQHIQAKEYPYVICMLKLWLEGRDYAGTPLQNFANFLEMLWRNM